MHWLGTIGYQAASMTRFVEALRAARVELVVDIRAVASSRRPGFSKSRLAANLAEAGIDYLHLRGLGTPADGRAAARAGKHAELERIYREHLLTAEARDQLASLKEIVRGGRRACLLCFEADPKHCHRSIVAGEVAGAVEVGVEDLSCEL